MMTLTPGCYVESWRGHYAHVDVIKLAQSLGFIVDPFAQWALDTFDDHHHNPNYPADTICELSDEAVTWLNSADNPGRGQNKPPEIPPDHVWEWRDGDFGLFPINE